MVKADKGVAISKLCPPCLFYGEIKIKEVRTMQHFVITIGCEYGAKGNAIGKKIAEDLKIPFYNRETVDAIIEEVGIPQEIMDKVESGVTIAGKGVEGQERGSFSKLSDLTQRAIHVQKQIIRKLAEKESCVFIGRSADYILILEKDKRYHVRHLAFTGSNRGDRHNRNLLIDSSLLGVEGTAEYIEILAKKVFGL